MQVVKAQRLWGLPYAPRVERELVEIPDDHPYAVAIRNLEEAMDLVRLLRSEVEDARAAWVASLETK